MEYVDGVNLRQAMRAGRFSPEQALAIVPGICDALQAAHKQGILHRDIKPENILLDREGKVKIADFGIARIVGDPQRDFTLTRTGNALGSVSYMAPEQHEKPHDVDHRADIYSLGVVIYEMLTGELPLGRFPAPSQRAAVDARIDEIVLKTLEKERELRQQSATEVKTDMHRAMQPGATGKARSEKPASSPKAGLAKLSFGLFLAGLLAFPLIAAFATVPTIVGIISTLAFLLLAFVFGLASWPELLAKIVVITTGTLLTIGLEFMAVSLPFFTLKTPISSEKPSRLDQQIATMPTEANAPPQPLPGYDFTSPRAAMESLIKAAEKGDVEAFKMGLSRSLLAMIDAHDSLDKTIEQLAACRLIAERPIDSSNAEVTLESDDNPMKSTFGMIMEDGLWKLTENVSQHR
jgi:serine/threonine protein kinase